ncbi:MAG: cytochrome c oxidase subunit [Chloroflexota bacterium]|nr:cytochrome c oxidase subunit [Chloroflexota bacterium]
MGRLLTERAARRSRLRKVAAAALGPLLLVVLTGCSQATTDQWKRLGLPVAVSDRSPYMESLWIGSWIAAFIIGFFVWGLILYASFRFRRKEGDEPPPQVRYNLPIEVLYTVAPIIVVVVLFYFTIQKLDKVNELVASPDHQVDVVAQRWSWTFDYLHEPAANNKNVYDQGTPATLPELWLVKGESVTFHLYSPDVVHSFWVPSFYFKLDVIPGRSDRSTQSFSMTPTRTGVFAGRCAELCGYLHSRMLFEVHVVDKAAFDKHMQALASAGQIGRPRGQSNSRTVSGLEATSQGSTS